MRIIQLKTIVAVQTRLKGPVKIQGGQAVFDGLTLANDYGKNKQELRHALCVTHPLLPNRPCRIDFEVSDHAGLAEAKRQSAEKNDTCHKASNEKVCVQQQRTVSLLSVTPMFAM